MTYEELCNDLRAEFPAFKIIFKDESFFMKLIHIFLMVVTLGKQRMFMLDYITTIGSTVYVPEDWSYMTEGNKVATLRHERVHMRQNKRYTALLFAFLYLVPFFPMGLAYFRARFELEAYVETMRADFEQFGQRILYNALYKKSIVDHFITAQYGWMWPFKKTVEGWYDAAADEILQGK